MMSKKTFVLIDNDTLIHKMWEMAAKKAQVKLFAFKSIEDFIINSKQLSTDTPIYIDSDLDDGVRGEVDSEKIFKLGFRKIYLATGQVELDITPYPWISKLVSKRPSF